ncbi:putative amino acid permease, partial [Aureobasidium melanogenum]
MPLWDKDEKTTDVVSHSQPADASRRNSTEEGIIYDTSNHLHRRLGNRQIQLIAIGGSIGTALFISIGGGLARGGPGSLLLAYLIYSCFIGLINNCIAEMTILYPVEGGFIRIAGHFVDEAFGFMASINFVVYELLCIPFEITALTTVLSFWSDDIPSWSIPLACIVLYGLLNILAVKAYGETEFWLSGGKVILIFILFGFTFVTMVGGNPQHEAYGFRNWDIAGAPFAVHRSLGTLGRFEGFCSALWSACFCIVGPEYISMVAAEAQRPRTYIKTAFKTVYWRFALFFVGGALTTGIVVAYNDPVLVGIISGTSDGAGTANASPYVIAMKNMSITGLPRLVNALLCTSIFSAGNTYTYCATLYCFALVMLFPFLSFLQVSNGSNIVLGWLTNLITGGGVITYIVMSTTYVFFYRALEAQGVDRKTLPYCGWFQPYSAYIGLAWMIMIITCYGYSSFAPWSVNSFFIYYTMPFLAIVTFTSWKVIKKTSFKRAMTTDLVWERPLIDAYEATLLEPADTFWNEMLGPLGNRRKRGDSQYDSSGNHSGME